MKEDLKVFRISQEEITTGRPDIFQKFIEADQRKREELQETRSKRKSKRQEEEKQNAINCL